MFGRIINRFKRKLRCRALRRSRVPLTLWLQALSLAPVLQRLSRHDRHRLRRLTGFFLQQKQIVGSDGFSVDDAMRVVIAAQACLLVLNLGLDYFDGWVEVIVYPGAFIVSHSQADESGVVHQQARALGGEAWGRGPVILSWQDIVSAPNHAGSGHNVVLHEFAHKLDMLNGAADGFPPLHADMPRNHWTEDLSEVYEVLKLQVLSHHRTVIDPYGAVSPAEFFAVVSETFFEVPERLFQHYPALYRELSDFYRQDPLTWRRDPMSGHGAAMAAYPTV